MTFPNNGFGRSLNDTPIFPITGLSLMTSCGCNLKCEYCLIDKAKKYNPKAAAELQKNTIKKKKASMTSRPATQHINTNRCAFLSINRGPLIIE